MTVLFDSTSFPLSARTRKGEGEIEREGERKECSFNRKLMISTSSSTPFSSFHISISDLVSHIILYWTDRSRLRDKRSSSSQSANLPLHQRVLLDSSSDEILLLVSVSCTDSYQFVLGVPVSGYITGKWYKERKVREREGKREKATGTKQEAPLYYSLMNYVRPFLDYFFPSLNLSFFSLPFSGSFSFTMF